MTTGKYVIDYWLSHSMEGMPVLSMDEVYARLRLQVMLLLNRYDDVRPSTVWYKDVNGDISKGYIGWRKESRS